MSNDKILGLYIDQDEDLHRVSIEVKGRVMVCKKRKEAWMQEGDLLLLGAARAGRVTKAVLLNGEYLYPLRGPWQNPIDAGPEYKGFLRERARLIRRKVIKTSKKTNLLLMANFGVLFIAVLMFTIAVLGYVDLGEVTENVSGATDAISR